MGSEFCRRALDVTAPLLLYSASGRSRVNPMAASDPRGQEEDGINRFDPRILDRSVIAIPLLEAISKDENQVHAVIIDLNLDYDGAARQRCYCGIPVRATGVHRRTGTGKGDFSGGSYRFETGALFSRRGVD
jgi:hypothetical protein